MNLTKEQAIKLGRKVMKDINFPFEEDEEDKVRAVFDNTVLKKGTDIWLVSFPYCKEDFGRSIWAHLSILDKEKRAVDISIRHGSIKLTYDENKDKYFREENT